jgi:hypothetical protein
MIPISVIYEDRIIELDKKLPDYTLLPGFLSKMKKDLDTYYTSLSKDNNLKSYPDPKTNNTSLLRLNSSMDNDVNAKDFISSLLNKTSKIGSCKRYKLSKSYINKFSLIFKHFKRCLAYFERTPVISYGIIGICETKGKKEFLICQRSNTYEYVEFIRGRYKYSDLFRLFSLMSKEEKERLLVDDFNVMLNKVISEDDNFLLDDIHYAESKFQLIKPIMPLLIKNTPDQEIFDFFPKGRKLRYGSEIDDVEITNVSYDVLTGKKIVTEIVETLSNNNLSGYLEPKANNNLSGYLEPKVNNNLNNSKEKETDLESAIRECKEETGVPKDLNKILIHDEIFYEAFLRSNGRVYITKYFVILFEEKEKVQDSFETMNVRWADIDNIHCEARLRKILQQVNNLEITSNNT